MAKQVFLEEWLRSQSRTRIRSSSNAQSSTVSSSARATIQAWSELRDSIQHQSFNAHHLQSLKTLLNSRASLHVADPQAKLLLSILSSPNLSLPPEVYPLFLRLLYIWVRKSMRPSLGLVDSAVEVLSAIFTVNFVSMNGPLLVSEGVLLLGAFSFVPLLSERSRKVCLELLCRLVEEDLWLVGEFGGHVPDILAGMGYALSSPKLTDDVYVRILGSLLGLWGKKEGPQSSVSHGLMILHLIEWMMSGWSLDKIEVFAQEALGAPKPRYIPCVLVMAAAGALRASNGSLSSGLNLEILSRLRVSAEECIEYIASNLISRTGGFTNPGDDLQNSLLLQCISLALAQSGPVSPRAPLLICLASALLIEIFPLRHFYTRIIEFPHTASAELILGQVKEHLDCVIFKEAGSITGVLCNQYASADEEKKDIVENLMWEYCQDIYWRHRQVALLLRGKEPQLLQDMEKIAESAFLMVVLFSLAVTKHRLSSTISQETRMEISVRILVSFSCLEYFRRIRLPEYMDTIREVFVSVQDNECACVLFMQSMPSYVSLTSSQDLSLQKMEYIWTKDEVQTARILFYMRVIPTCIECMPTAVFRKVVAPMMFLYVGHPNGKVARASHSLFAAFIASGIDTDEDEKVLLKEQLVFYYIQRSLAGYPGITPFEGMASGVVALVRYLPPGSPSIFYCIHSLIEKANQLCIEVSNQNADEWKNWQGESEPFKKIIELLIRLLSLVDVQVLPNLMKLLAQLIVQLPKDGQNMVLDELYSLVAESDDVTRKHTFVSWLQSLSYLCSQGNTIVVTPETGDKSSSSSLDGLHARL